MNIRHLVSAVVATLGFLAGSLGLASAPALADPGFAPPVAFPTPAPEGFVPVGVAVDNSAGLDKGDVYVTGQAHDTIYEYNAAGTEVKAQVVVAGAELAQLTVDSNPGLREGDVYVAGKASGVVYRFGPGLTGEEAFIAGLEQPTDVAVDGEGDVFVTEEGAGKVLEFNAKKEPINAKKEVVGLAGNTVIEGLSGPQALALDASGDLYVATGSGTLQYTLSKGVYTVAENPLDAVSSSGVTVAPSGDVYVDQDEFGLGEIEQYSSSGALLNRAGRLHLSQTTFGVGVSEESHSVYVADEGEKVVDVFEEGAEPEPPVTEPGVAKGLTAVLNGTLAGNTTGYYFVYAEGASCEGEGEVKSPEMAATGGQVHVEVTGLQALTQYSFCLVATNRFGSTLGSSVSLETSSVKPAITKEAATNVGAHGARLGALVNPENLAGSYYFEYSTGTGEPSRTPEASFVKGTSSAPVEALVEGLQPDTEYHFHLVARNGDGESSEGAEVAFRTLAAAVTSLPDGRVYEMVTPPENHDADVHVPVALPAGESLGEGTHTQLPVQVATDGSAVTYTADPTEGGLGHGGNGAGNQYLARLKPGGGWAQRNIQPAGRNSTFYQGFSGDLSVGILNSGGESEPRLAPLADSALGDGYSILYTCVESVEPCTTGEEERRSAESLPVAVR